MPAAGVYRIVSVHMPTGPVTTFTCTLYYSKYNKNPNFIHVMWTAYFGWIFWNRPYSESSFLQLRHVGSAHINQALGEFIGQIYTEHMENTRQLGSVYNTWCLVCLQSAQRRKEKHYERLWHQQLFGSVQISHCRPFREGGWMNESHVVINVITLIRVRV